MTIFIEHLQVVSTNNYNTLRITVTITQNKNLQSLFATRCLVTNLMWLTLHSWILNYCTVCSLLRMTLLYVKSKSHCDWRSVSQSISKSWFIFITVWQLRSYFLGACSLTRGRVCLLYMLLALASAVFLGSESQLLFHIWGFPCRRLLRIAGSQWRYSTSPSHG
jgi:hypothetical protein